MKADTRPLTTARLWMYILRTVTAWMCAISIAPLSIWLYLNVVDISPFAKCFAITCPSEFAATRDAQNVSGDPLMTSPCADKRDRLLSDTTVKTPCYQCEGKQQATRIWPFSILSVTLLGAGFFLVMFPFYTYSGYLKVRALLSAKTISEARTLPHGEISRSFLLATTIILLIYLTRIGMQDTMLSTSKDWVMSECEIRLACSDNDNHQIVYERRADDALYRTNLDGGMKLRESESLREVKEGDRIDCYYNPSVPSHMRVTARPVTLRPYLISVALYALGNYLGLQFIRRKLRAAERTTKEIQM